MPLQEVRVVGSTDTKEIICGEDRTIFAELLDKLTNAPFDYDTAIAKFLAQDGTAIQVTMTPVGGGICSGTMTHLQSASLATGDGQSWQLEVTTAGAKTIVQFDDLMVDASLF